MDTTKPALSLDMLKGTVDHNVRTMSLVLQGGDDSPEVVGVIDHTLISNYTDNYRQNFFDGVNVSEEMMRYLYYYYFQLDKEPRYGNQDELAVMLDRNMWGDRQADEHRVAQKIKYSVVDDQCSYIIGFILVVTSIMETVQKDRRTVRLEIEEPFEYIDQPDRFVDLLTLIITDHNGVISKTTSNED